MDVEEEQSLKDVLRERMESGTGDEAPSTPESAPEPPAVATKPQEPDAGDEAPSTPEPDDATDAGLLARLKQEHPDNPELVERLYQSINSEFKRGLTPRLQEAAELKRQLEGVDTAAIQWVRQFNQALSTNPDQARAMLQAEQERLFAASQPPEATEYPDRDQFVTDAEWEHEQKIRQLEQKLAQMSEQAQRAEVQRLMFQQFDALEQDAGVKFSPEDRIEHIKRMAQMGLPYNAVSTYWWGTAGREKVLQQGRDEGLRIAQQKAGMGAPPSSQVLNEPQTQAEPKSLLEALERKGLGR